ncbi:putative membrane protein YphA (DoxX/SURF4 family) [Acinetobacter baylyi]|uniref:Membrane protein YphA (DoxX/SURF4 family) n=1 Tax=Acinetobacter baylyi TaxID=202950 RepID=A0ABU0UUU1_ACIBI|nr:DoxX family protein [Acinetobacter baylyi]MDQ1208311.1 putative membrane protein YphA (DoxX/SURF4 family) [Acinetobacter baylyi]MDR6108099.1 putative membrane protein YphA (DoxX/SURF4 family) [Acinetobacter baylyi]MDR6185183.1 putative membrane protein YphA (DoxX/SURF4 family) [Acinetobacter baylyi]
MKNILHFLAQCYQNTCTLLKHADGIAALALRCYLTPIFWMAGTNKLIHFQDTVEWFGNTDWGLGLPFPYVMAALATSTEIAGAVLLALGLFTRFMSIPLIITMLVAIFSVHLPNGWQAIADPNAPFANAQVLASSEKLDKAREILMAYGNYDWLTSSGSLVILNNGVEFAVTYLIMLIALMVLGGGRYLSVDYWIQSKLKHSALW